MRRASVLVSAYLLLSCSLSAQTSYDFTVFQNSGATVTRVLGLNGLGKLVGMDDVIRGRHAFVGGVKRQI